MKITSFVLLVFTALFTCLSCEEFNLNTESETFFHVDVSGTELPVLVRGKYSVSKVDCFH